MASLGVLWGHGQGQQRPAGGVGPSPALPIREICGVLTSSNPRPKVGLQAWRITSAAGSSAGQWASSALVLWEWGWGRLYDYKLFLRLREACSMSQGASVPSPFEPLEHVIQEA